jgi:hypothetical protein
MGASNCARKIGRRAERIQQGSTDVIGSLEREVLSNLTELLSGEGLGAASEELLRQCTVLCWGALEVLSTDLFVCMLNECPSKTSELLNHSSTKKYFDPKAFGAVLVERQYDLSHCMGEVLLQQRRLDSVDAIRNVFEALFPDETRLRTQLQDDVLWRHRRAIVDEQYRANTGYKQALGSRLRISPDHFEVYLTFVRDAGVELLRAARTLDG